MTSCCPGLVRRGCCGNRISSFSFVFFLIIRHECNPQYAPPSVIQKGPTSVARHFGRNQHTRDDLKVQILELIRLDPPGPHTDAYRETSEHFWIHRLRTFQPLDLNANDEIKYKNRNEEMRLPHQPHLTNPGQQEVTLVSLKKTKQLYMFYAGNAMFSYISSKHFSNFPCFCSLQTHDIALHKHNSWVLLRLIKHPLVLVILYDDCVIAATPEGYSVSGATTPQTEVARQLGMIGDMVEAQYGDALQRVISKILNRPREQVTYDVIRSIMVQDGLLGEEVTKWKQVRLLGIYSMPIRIYSMPIRIYSIPIAIYSMPIIYYTCTFLKMNNHILYWVIFICVHIQNYYKFYNNYI